MTNNNKLDNLKNLKDLSNFLNFYQDMGILFFTEKILLSNDKYYKPDNLKLYENNLSCKLTKNKINFFPGVGNPTSKFLLVSNTLTNANFRNRKQFCDNSSFLLQKMFESIDISISEIFIINFDPILLNSKFKDNNLDNSFNFNIILRKYLELTKPNFIINMTDQEFKDIYNENDNVFVIKIDNPAKLINNPSLKRNAWINLKILRDKIKDAKF